MDAHGAKSLNLGLHLIFGDFRSGCRLSAATFDSPAATACALFVSRRWRFLVLWTSIINRLASVLIWFRVSLTETKASLTDGLLTGNISGRTIDDGN